MNLLLDFMYSGTVTVEEGNLQSLIEAAETCLIRGLMKRQVLEKKKKAFTGTTCGGWRLSSSRGAATELCGTGLWVLINFALDRRSAPPPVRLLRKLVTDGPPDLGALGDEP